MTSPLKTPDFFSLEAGEALDGLEKLLRSTPEPAPEELVRTVRLLRGAALMANQQPIARAAGALELLARQYRDGRATWSAALGDGITQSIAEFRSLIGRVREWSETDTARALRLGRTLELLGGQGAGAAVSDAPDGTIASGVRAFVAREGALIASALDRAARAVRVSPADREPLFAVIRRMQSLRGLAELGELAPLPEMLDSIELTVGDLTRMFAPPPGVGDVVEAAAHALTRLSRDVAESGRPDPNSAETRRFSELLVRVFAIEQDVVAIESLYFQNDPEPMKQAPTAAGFQGDKTLGPLELVSHGEHLCRTADLLTNARSATERDLRLYQLLGTLRGVSVVGPDPVAAALAVFARSVRDTLAAGVTERQLDPLVSCLREAGELLRSVADSDDRMRVSRRLLDVAHKLSGAMGPMRAVDDDERDVVPIEQLLLADPSTTDELPIVPIESLAPDAEAELAEAPSALETSFRTYRRLLRERPDELPSLAALLRQDRGGVASTVVNGQSPSDEPVAIGDLCYRGRAALERADAVRRDLSAELAQGRALSDMRPLLDELLDLVPLALAEH